MNAYPYTTNFIGATGEYPINEYINKVEINSSNFTLLNSNILNTKIIDTSNILNTKIIDTSNILQGQITATSNLIYKDEDRNTIVKISAQNPEYPLIGNPVEMRFQNVNNEYLTKIIQTGELYVYHPVSVIPVGYGPSWWSVEGKLSFAIQETIGLRFDVTQLQATTGTSAITSSTEAAAAVAASGAGAVAVGAATGAAGTAIAGGDYGTVAVGAAAGALAAVLGYLSYQAQRASNLNSNGFTTEAGQVHSNIDIANLLLASNINNICIAKGFVNCNITNLQTVSNLNTHNITLNNQNISNIFLAKDGGTMYNSLVFQKNTSGNPTVGYFGGFGDRVIYEPSTTTTDYACSIGINNTTKNMWFSASSNYGYQWWVNGLNMMSLTSNGNLIINNGSFNGVGSFITELDYNNITLNKPTTFPPTMTNIYSKTETDNFLNAKQNNLTFQSPLINTANTITLSTTNLITTAGGQTINGSLTTTGTITENGKTIPTIAQETILNSTPRVAKKIMITGTCSSSILMPDGFTYFAYDIDLRTYTQTKTAPNPSTPYRIFNIKVFFGSVYFGYLTNNKPNVLSYEVYMSNESQAGGGGIGSAGLNVCAIGYPENVILNAISPTQLSLVCGDFNFISILSRVNGTVFNAIIEDCLA